MLKSYVLTSYVSISRPQLYPETDVKVPAVKVSADAVSVRAVESPCDAVWRMLSSSSSEVHVFGFKRIISHKKKILFKPKQYA